MAEQIDDLRLRYAERTGPAGTDPSLQALQWRKANQINDWQQVRAVGLSLQLRPDGITLTPGNLSSNTQTPLKNGASAWWTVFFLNHAGP
ncbi:MAG: hypothetical protein EXR37_04235 [Limnohabitans sp.]|nr:hypothetical protein [Limnohabitans sp.]